MSTEPLSIVSVIRAHAVQRPERICYTFLADGETETDAITYGALDERARAIARLLHASGRDRGPILLAYPPGIDFIASFLGCLYAGAIAVPVYPPGAARGAERLLAIVEDAQATSVLTTDSVLTRVHGARGHESLARLQWISTDTVDVADADAWTSPATLTDGTTGNPPAFLQYTSGSTGTPTGVIVGHANLLDNQRAIQHAFRQSSESIVVSWLPPYHDMGLIGGLLQPIYAGALCILMPPLAFLQRPARWLEAITRYQATTSGGPNFAYELCTRKVSAQDRAGLDLRSWTVAFNGAEPVRAETLETFAQTFAPCGFQARAFQPCYGLAEATLLVSGTREPQDARTKAVSAVALAVHRVADASRNDDEVSTLLDSGRPACGTRIAIVDPETAIPVGPGRVGEIWVTGKSVASGYWRRPEETARTFGARLRGDAAGADADVSGDAGADAFLRTGDLGFLDGGRLFVTGRIKDIIIIRGLNHYPQDVEFTAQRSHPSLVAGGGAAFAVEADGEERLVVVQEVDRRGLANPHAVIAAIRERLSREHELSAGAVALVKPGAVPKTTSGKVQRSACRQMWDDGTLAGVAEWREWQAAEAPVETAGPLAWGASASEIQSWIVRHLAARLRVAPSAVDASASIAHHGIDSLMAIELVQELQQQGFDLPATAALRETTIVELAATAAVRPRVRVAPPAAGSAVSPATDVGSHRPEPDRVPMTQGQRALWLLHQRSPDRSVHHLAMAARLRGALDRPALDRPALARAVSAVVSRHAPLRSTFVAADDDLWQVAHAEPRVDWQEVDGATWTDEETRRWLTTEASRPFDLTAGPLLRIALVRTSEDALVLLLVAHHLAADFASLGIFLQELQTAYDAERTGTPAALPPLPSTYAAEVARENAMLKSERGEALWRFWQTRLDGVRALNLPLDHPRPPQADSTAASERLQLDAVLVQRIKAAARARGVTPHVVLLASLAALLGRHARQTDVSIGSLASGRTSAASRSLIGYFVKPILLRLDLTGRPSFATLLERTRQTLLDAVEHQDYPFSSIIERLHPARGRGGTPHDETPHDETPLLQVMFTLLGSHQPGLEDLPAFVMGEPGGRLDLLGGSMEPFALDTVSADGGMRRETEFDLDVIAAETGDELTLGMRYRPALWEPATIQRLLAQWRTLLEVQTLDEFSLLKSASDVPLASAEGRQAIARWNETGVPHGTDVSVVEAFERQAARTPEAIAATSGDASISYEALNGRANQLARHLRARGVDPDTLVAVCLDRSIDLLVALLGILKAGGAYMLLDPADPDARLALVLEEAQPFLLVTQRSLVERLSTHRIETVCLDGKWPALSYQPRTDLAITLDPRTLAYVMFTSGTTGRPKGVMISHASAINFLAGMEPLIAPPGDGVWVGSASDALDISVLELLGSISRGQRVAIETSAPRPDASGSGGSASSRPIELSLLCTIHDTNDEDETSRRYRQLLDVARFADEHDFTALWMPEGHFDAADGLNPNPSVTAAAVAAITSRVRIRAGSLLSPLHDPIRIAEEWAVVDNLSDGRVGVAFRADARVEDRVIGVGVGETSGRTLAETMADVRRLWRGEAVVRRDGAGNRVDIHVRPSPVQRELPVWLDAGSNADAFRDAGAVGAFVLSDSVDQTIEDLAAKIVVYRDAWRAGARGMADGHVTLVLRATGDADDTAALVCRAQSAGVDEVALVVDLGGDAEQLSGDLSRLQDVKDLAARLLLADIDGPAEQVEIHGHRIELGEIERRAEEFLMVSGLSDDEAGTMLRDSASGDGAADGSGSTTEPSNADVPSADAGVAR